MVVHQILEEAGLSAFNIVLSYSTDYIIAVCYNFSIHPEKTKIFDVPVAKETKLKVLNTVKNCLRVENARAKSQNIKYFYERV